MVKNNRAWLLLIPMLVVLSINAFIPLITVINYSFQDILPGLPPIFVGLENFKRVLSDPAFIGALGRQLVFSFTVLLLEVPLGILVALAMPRRGIGVPVMLVILGIPLLIPWNVVGILWRVFTRADLGLVPIGFQWFGYDYNAAIHATDAWWTVVAMDVWHWTPLVVLLCYAGLRAIPEAYYRATKIDGASRWATLRYVTLPKLRTVLTIAVLLRFMDSFKIYSEPFILTGGGPGNTTTFLSDYLVRKAVGGFELGFSAALSLIYLYIILAVSYLLFQVLTRVGQGGES